MLFFYAEFQSTPPVKAATLQQNPNTVQKPISIHAAREGGDREIRLLGANDEISIHAAREGGDRAVRRDEAPQRDFNPRRP